MSKGSFGGAFKRIKDALSGKPAQGNDTASAKGNKYLEPEKGPLDVQFAREFTEATGKFLYCEHEAELVESLHRLSLEYNWTTVYARENELSSILQRANIDFDTEDRNADAFVSTCAFLSAYDGGIVVSSAQTGGEKLNCFPSTHIVIAYTSQLHKNLSEGMRWFKSQSEEIPSNITTVQVNKIENTSGIRREYDPAVHHDVFLLLVEDQAT
jgi:L-lactate dehydrogenase complex protein LldG